MATFTLQALVLNSDLLLRSDFLFGCSHYSLFFFLNVADIRFQCELVTVLNWPAYAKKNYNENVTCSTLSYGCKLGGHLSQCFIFKMNL